MKLLYFLPLFVVLSGLGLFAQEETPPDQKPEAPPIESEWVDFDANPYTKGDKTFVITLGVLFPTYFGGPYIQDNDHGLSTGGTASLSLNYFLTSRLFLGGELSGMFAFTRGKNTLYMVPFGARVGYQFVFRRFEFPLSLMAGFAPTRYLELEYFGLILKPGAAIFWRFKPEWSFGLNGVWWFVPQSPRDKYTAYGNFMELTLSARYHF